jgi:putative membrane protein
MTNPSETNPPEPARGGPLEGEPARLHPAVLGVWAARGAVSIIFLVLVAGMVPAVGGAILAALGVGMIVRWIRFQWRLEPDAVVIEEGLFVRKRRIIPRERIQTVDLERGIVHRLLGVSEVRIEAIGSGGTEGRLSAVRPELADELRRVLLARSRLPAPTSEQAPEPGAVEPPSRLLARVAPEGLVLAGLTGGRVGVVAALVGFFFQAVPETWWTETLGRILQQAPDPTTVVGFRVLMVMGVFALLTGFFLSVVATVFAHWDFTLSSTDGTLEVRRGLFTEHRDTVPYRRVQAVRIEENLVRRLLGRGALRAVVAGRAGVQSDEGTDLLLPIGRRDELHRLARGAVGLEGGGEPDLEPMPRRARTRRHVRALFGSLLVAGAVAAVAALRWEAGFWSVGGWTFAGVVLPALLLAEGAYRGLGRADLGTHVVVREGVVNRRTTYLAVDRLQALETTANPFQRVGRLATVHLQVARPVMGTSPRALDLTRDAAADWRELLARRVARPVPVRAVDAGVAR